MYCLNVAFKYAEQGYVTEAEGYLKFEQTLFQTSVH